MEFSYEKVYGLPYTQRIYNSAPYFTELDATVLYVEGRLAVFDQTIFYAESGGQVCDTGSVVSATGEAYTVTDVQHRLGHKLYLKRAGVDVPIVDVETRIVHVFSAAPHWQPGERVTLRIDWPRRYAVMRHHTLAHFLFSALQHHFSTAGRQIGVRGCVIDADRAAFSLDRKLSDDDVSAILAHIRQMLAQNSPMWIEAAPETDSIFYWHYGETLIPCGGTHVRTLDEICDGEIHLYKKNSGRDRSHLYITTLPLG